MFEAIEKEIKAIFGILLSICGIIVIISIGYVLYDQLLHHTISIGTISVPTALTERGYTDAVASARLRDAIQKIIDQINKPATKEENSTSAKIPPQISLGRSDIPNVITPTLSIPIPLISR